MVRPADEARARAGRGGGHLLAAVSDDRRSALVARVARWAEGAQLHVAVLGIGLRPLVLVDLDLPATNDRWEFRTSGLWVELVVEQPGIHWSSGLEAFAIGLDDPEELLGRGYGHRTPLGWELDFVGEADEVEQPSDGLEYQPVRVDGLILTGTGESETHGFEGQGLRWSWDSGAAGPPVDLGGRPEGAMELPAMEGPATEIALPLVDSAVGGPVWWVGHDGRSLTSRLTVG